MGLDMMLIRRKKGVKDFEDWYENGDEIMYWRKANAVHKWFVDNVQGGEDDCGYYLVTKEQLEQLKEICGKIVYGVKLKSAQVKNGYTLEKKEDGSWEKVYQYEDGVVISNPELCEELLPTQEGFFFGSYDYDTWYLRDIEATFYKIDMLLTLFDFNSNDLYYHSSW